MKNFFLLLILAGLIFAGWHFRGSLNPFSADEALPSEKSTPSNPESRPPEPQGLPTPHPGTESMITAKKTYPALAIQGSAFQQKFRVLHAEAFANEPNFLAQPDWPLRLAERTAHALGGGVMPAVGTPAPARTPMPISPSRLGESSKLHGSPLDITPNPDKKPKH